MMLPLKIEMTQKTASIMMKKIKKFVVSKQWGLSEGLK
jgi:hypothetical protein